ncbi:MAG: phosphotransferase [Deltaproteobacteria bacterium]|nr:phosphotransferase [Deltaproteobacteria bacterium]MBI3387039.1 phosphotransferase [Deltaproteobacteria bacterium]
MHVSLAIAEATDAFLRILEYLREEMLSFKLPNSLGGVSALNSGLAGPTQFGKVLTIYPSSTAQACLVAKHLDSVIPVRRGPRVPSDRYLRADGAISLRYGSFTLDRVLVDAFGRFEPAIETPFGLSRDERTATGRQSAFADPLPLSLEPQHDHSALATNDALFRKDSTEYVPLCLLQQTPRGRVFLAGDINSAQTVIIKTAEQGVMSDIAGHDAASRLLNEFRVLRQLRQAGLTVAPEPIVMNAEVPWMAVADVQGETVDSLPPDQQLLRLADAADRLARVHEAGFVHRDVKLANILATHDEVVLIDWELASRIGSEEPIIGGTRGHVAPEVIRGKYAAEQATPMADVFGVGASVAHALLRCNPALLPAGSGRLIGLLVLGGNKDAAIVVRRCVAADVARRPTAADVRDSIRRLRVRTAAMFLQTKVVKRGSRRWALRAAYEVANLTRRYRSPTPGGTAWQNRHFQADFLCESINLGAAGIIIGLLTIAEFTRRDSHVDDVQRAAEWLANAAPPKASCGLFTGNAGVALALALVGTRFGEPRFIAASLERLGVAAEARDEQDLFAGAAGVLWAGAAIGRLLGEVARDIVAPLARWLNDTVVVRDDLLVWRNSGRLDSAKEPFTGAAHGAAGIALALRVWSSESRQIDGTLLAREILLRLYEKARVEPGDAMRRSLDVPVLPTPSNEWCHGSMGYVWCALQAFPNDPAFEPAIDWAASRLYAAPRVSNVTFCHGLAGQLEVWRMLTRNARWDRIAQHRSSEIAACLRLLTERSSGLTTWCAEDPNVFTPDLWVGFLGPATAVARHFMGESLPLMSLD